MRFINHAARTLALLFTIALIVRAVANKEKDKDVLTLVESNFTDAVSDHRSLLVEFYAPWCGHCKSLEPEYTAAAKNLKKTHPSIRLAKVDATADTKLGEQFDVRGFPTLKFFKGTVESVIEYDGGRSAAEIEQWVIKKSGPAVTIIETTNELEDIQEANEVVVFAVLDALNSETHTLLENLADADSAAVYVASTSTDVTEDVTAVNKVVLYKKFDEGKVVYDGVLEKEPLSMFVKSNSMPLVVTFTKEKAPRIFGGEITNQVLVIVDTSKDYVAGIEAAFKTAAQINKGKLLHVIMPSTEEKIIEYFGIKSEDMPVILIVNISGSLKKYAFGYKADDLIAKIEIGLADDLLVFEKNYFEGTLSPQLKSAEPEDDSNEAVKVIVGQNFQQRVVDNDNDVLLEFYAPWCGHCKSFASEYEELAVNFADVESIMIAKIDATANELDHPGVDVRGFPTLIFFPAKNKRNPIVYEGSRDVDGLTEFLKTNAQKFELDGSEYGAEQTEEDDKDEQEQKTSDEEEKEGAEHEEL